MRFIYLLLEEPQVFTISVYPSMLFSQKIYTESGRVGLERLYCPIFNIQS